MKMVDENPIYFGLDYSTSLKSKKELLSLEMTLLNLIKSVRRYKLLRQEEFKIKLSMYKEIKELNIKIRKTYSSFPFFKIPKKMQRVELKKSIRKNVMPKEEIDIDLEFQLKDIQDRLKSIGQ